MIGIGYTMDLSPRILAVLIDGDNIKPAYYGRVMAWAARHGTVSMRRIYGNIGKLSDWKGCISNHGLEPVPNCIEGKNVADVMLTIHAVEILRSEKGIDGFCIAASDNDFAGLANWLRGEGAFVVGTGSMETKPLEFKRECDCFEYVEDLPPEDDPDPVAQRKLSIWKDAVREAIQTSEQDDGWVLLADVGNKLKGAESGFDYSVYCHSDLLPLTQSCLEFETESNPERVRLRPQEP